MNWDQVCYYIAQGAINITEGVNTIEAGSPVHKAMIAFCEYLSTGQVTFHPPLSHATEAAVTVARRKVPR